MWSPVPCSDWLIYSRSAPEILLAIVGIVANGFQQDSLGPSLIVGSGAFNLLFLSAIRCVVCRVVTFMIF